MCDQHHDHDEVPDLFLRINVFLLLQLAIALSLLFTLVGAAFGAFATYHALAAHKNTVIGTVVVLCVFFFFGIEMILTRWVNSILHKVIGPASGPIINGVQYPPSELPKTKGGKILKFIRYSGDAPRTNPDTPFAPGDILEVVHTTNLDSGIYVQRPYDGKSGYVYPKEVALV